MRGKADPYLIFLKNRSSGAHLVVPTSGEYKVEVDALEEGGEPIHEKVHAELGGEEGGEN